MYVNVQLVHLGRGVREMVFQNEDGGHTVFIDDQLAPEAMRAAYRHAMHHIEEDDFGKHGNVGDIEREAHAAAGSGSGEDPAVAARDARHDRGQIKNPAGVSCRESNK